MRTMELRRGYSPGEISLLEKHPWYANQWQARLQNVSVVERERDLVLFMQAARWPDDIRIQDKGQNRPSWHYINLPFKPEGQPANVQAREPEPVNILTAMAENESRARNENDPERKAIALAWLFHLVGDIHQPLHTTQLFTVEYPTGDRGGNQICVRVRQAGQPMDLHRFWDDGITSSSNLTRLRNEATVLRNRQGFQRGQLTELANTDIEAWVKESYEIATKIYNEVRLRLVSLVLKKTTTLIERVLLVKGKIICSVGEGMNQSHRQQGFS
jgi:S1/P1 Nuclease